MWVSFVVVDGPEFVGKTIQVAKGIAWIAPGERLRFGEADLYDWMVNEGGHIHGGYTLRVMRPKLPEHRKAAYDRYIGAVTYE